MAGLRFRIGRVPVTVTPIFLVVSVFFAWPRVQVAPILLVEWTVVVFVSILLHELGHAAAARSFGLDPWIEIHGMGGTTYTRRPADFPAWRSIVISLSGPGAGFLLGGAAWAWSELAPARAGVLAVVQLDLVRINVLWGALNLLPILPLDGGNVLEQLLVRRLGDRGRFTAYVVSVVLALGLAAVAILHGWLWAGFLLVFLTAGTARTMMTVRARDRDRDLEPLRDELTRTLEAKDLAAAVRIARSGLSRAKSPEWRAMFAEVVVRASLALDDVDAAVQALGHFPDAIPPPPGLEATVLYHAGRFDAAAEADLRGFALGREPVHAFNAACSLVRAGRPREALDALRRAVDAGWDDVDALDSDEDLAPIRDRPEFAAIRAAAASRRSP